MRATVFVNGLPKRLTSPLDTSVNTEWKNWGRTEHVIPAQVASPGSAAEVAHVVRAAAEQKLPVKAVGSGHSFTGVAVAPGVQLQMDRLCGLREIDREAGLVTVGAGTKLWQLNELLAASGLAMPNLGDIDRQTISGATSTGT